MSKSKSIRLAVKNIGQITDFGGQFWNVQSLMQAAWITQTDEKETMQNVRRDGCLQTKETFGLSAIWPLSIQTSLGNGQVNG